MKKKSAKVNKKLSAKNPLNFVCTFCDKAIKIVDEKYVQLSTFNAVDQNTKKKFDKHIYYHFQCFLDQYNKGMEERIKERFGQSLEQVKAMLDNPIFKNLKITTEATNN